MHRTLHAALALATLSVASACGGGGTSSEAEASARFEAIRGALSADLDGAVGTGTDGTDRGLGVSDGRVDGALVIARSVDWSHVDLARVPGGAVGAIVAQADQHAEALAHVGLVPVGAVWSAIDAPLPCPPAASVAVAITVDDGRSGGQVGSETQTPICAESRALVQRRVYVAPGSGAVLFVRLSYDRSAQRLDVDASYADQTQLHAAYPTGTITYTESVVVP